MIIEQVFVLWNHKNFKLEESIVMGSSNFCMAFYVTVRSPGFNKWSFHCPWRQACRYTYQNRDLWPMISLKMTFLSLKCSSVVISGSKSSSCIITGDPVEESEKEKDAMASSLLDQILSSVNSISILNIGLRNRKILLLVFWLSYLSFPGSALLNISKHFFLTSKNAFILDSPYRLGVPTMFSPKPQIFKYLNNLCPYFLILIP